MSTFYSTFAVQLNTNTTMAKKVYTLLRTSATRGENAEDVRVFSKRKDAIEQMNKEFIAEREDWKSWCDEDSLRCEVEEHAMCIYEGGYYSYNHIDWKVKEKEVL